MPEAIPNHLRLFIAISIPEQIRKEIETTQNEMRQALAAARVRWTRVDQFHLTLRFLGDVDENRVKALGDAVAAGCRTIGPLTLCARGLGCFPNARRPRVIWAGASDSGDLLSGLQRMIQESTREFTREEPEVNFSGHVTLARIKEINRMQTQILRQLIEGGAEKSWGEWMADYVEIIRSELSAEGARHSRVMAAPLGRK